MTCYKLINEEFYSEGKTFSTSSINYSRFIGDVFENKDFYNYIFESTDKYKIGIDTFVIITNNINLFGLEEVYVDLIKGFEQIPLAQISEHADKYATKELYNNILLDICKKCQNSGVVFASKDDAVKLWEYLYEIVRIKFFPDAPSRLQSYFSFQAPTSIDYYRQVHQATGISCEIDSSFCTATFAADMKFVDMIENYHTYSEAENLVKQYWTQQKSTSPIIEILLQGDITIGKKIES